MPSKGTLTSAMAASGLPSLAPLASGLSLFAPPAAVLFITGGGVLYVSNAPGFPGVVLHIGAAILAGGRHLLVAPRACKRRGSSPGSITT